MMIVDHNRVMTKSADGHFGSRAAAQEKKPTLPTLVSAYVYASHMELWLRMIMLVTEEEGDQEIGAAGGGRLGRRGAQRCEYNAGPTRGRREKKKRR